VDSVSPHPEELEEDARPESHRVLFYVSLLHAVPQSLRHCYKPQGDGFETLRGE
jgi:hypothetical protein